MSLTFSRLFISSEQDSNTNGGSSVNSNRGLIHGSISDISINQSDNSERKILDHLLLLQNDWSGLLNFAYGYLRLEPSSSIDLLLNKLTDEEKYEYSFLISNLIKIFNYENVELVIRVVEILDREPKNLELLWSQLNEKEIKDLILILPINYLSEIKKHLVKNK